MAIQRHDVTFDRLSDDLLAQWRDIPPAIVSDMMNRTQCMAGRIKPVKKGMALCGQARTVTCMVGDNSAAHYAIGLVKPGEILVIDAGGYADVAIWGGIMTHGAIAKRAGGVVIDGAMRDVAEIAEMGLPAFCAAHVPQGPHKGFGGVIDGVISCGGATVAPGDIVIGDDDGVAVVPLARQAELLAASLKKIADEEATIARIKAGETTARMMGLPEPELLR
ncbi:MAG: dimethylmenaquinone methyltransferase [Rhodospirillales bacterium CG15_BIG_FIL_POST_REV_8_21_14_020_66_15]|nr:MAG: dimethylmenaquinone methyltransferase [Rhodospirillales bacterium CG15_BIG_FIL_POST_REV_8_21_14_020_66_15]